VVLASAVLLVAGRVYQPRWRDDLQPLLRVLIIDTVAIVAGIAITRPYGALRPPNRSVVLFFLLALLFLGGVRLLHDPWLHGFRSRPDTHAA
jgi:hypothetical protein